MVIFPVIDGNPFAPSLLLSTVLSVYSPCSSLIVFCLVFRLDSLIAAMRQVTFPDGQKNSAADALLITHNPSNVRDNPKFFMMKPCNQISCVQSSAEDRKSTRLNSSH